MADNNVAFDHLFSMHTSLDTDTLSGKAHVNTKAASEMLVRWHLGTLQELAEECERAIDVTLVKSYQNRSDCLTRVPERWLDLHRKGVAPQW